MLKVTKDITQMVYAKLALMGTRQVLVGIPDGGSRDGITNAELGYIHEKGSPAANIPPRPFLEVGVASVNQRAAEILKKAAIAELNNHSAFEKSLNQIGLIAQSAVKKRITSSEGMKPLSAKTLAARKRAGAKGTRPLIRTGQLLNSITYVLRDK